MKKKSNKFLARIIIMSSVAVVCVMFLLMTCGCSGPPKRTKPRLANITGPTKVIVSDAKKTKDVSNEIRSIAPDLEPQTVEIDQYQDNILVQTELLEVAAEDNVKLSKFAESETSRADKNEAELVEKTEELENKRVNGLVKILYIIVVVGFIMMVAGAVMFFHSALPSKLGWQIAAIGGFITGLAMFTIKYLTIIIITFGIIFTALVVFIIYQVITHKKHEDSEGIINDMFDTFKMTDKKEISKGQRHKTELKVAQLENAANIRKINLSNGGTL